MRCANLGDVHLQPRVLADEDARGAGVVEMDVRQEEVPQVAQLEPAFAQPGLERADARGRAAVEQRRAVFRLDARRRR